MPTFKRLDVIDDESSVGRLCVRQVIELVVGPRL